MHRPRGLTFCIVALVLLPACGLDYYAQLVTGTLASFSRSRPISHMLEDPAVDEATKARLRLALEVRQFGIDAIGQNAGPAFLLFDDDSAVADTGTLGFAVGAAAKDSLTPKTWIEPFVGEVEYRDFFNREDADRFRQQLDAEGYDTTIARISGLSTLGILPDPLRASQIALPDAALVEVILHELTHNTVFKTGDTSFNESLAQFVGRNAARRVYLERRGEQSPETDAALGFYSDEDLVDDFIAVLFDGMNEFYSQPIPSEAKIAGRQQRFDELAVLFDTDFRPRLSNPERFGTAANLTLNNARILGASRYRGNLPIYQDVLNQHGGDFRAWWDVIRRAAREEDSFAFLQSILTGS
jgi:predicted aminopeptidase